MSRLRWGAPFAAALLLSAPFAGCDDGGGGGSAPDLSINFVSPLEGATLDCGDDLDRDTDDALDFTVEALVALKGSDPEGLRARLTAEGHDGFVVTATVPASGRVLFGSAPLPLDDELVLKLALLDGDDEVATAQRTIHTGIDPASDECRTVPVPPTLSFERPTDGTVFGAADDADGNLGNGLQVEVVIGVAGEAPGRIALEIDGAATAEADIANGKATFAEVTLPVGAEPREVRLAATAPGTAARTEIGVRVEIDACTLTLSPQPGGDGCDVLAAADLDPNTPGVQAELTAETNCARVTFEVNGDRTEPVEVEGGIARAEVTLVEGENTVGATATGDGGLSAEVEPYMLVVDAAPPVLGLELSAIGANLIGHEGNERLPDGGFRATLRGTAEGLPAGATVRVAFDPPLPGAVDDEVTVGADGRFAIAAEITDFACGRTLTVSAVDDCGNEGRSPAYTVCFDPVEPRLTIVEPADGAAFQPLQDDLPEVDGKQITATVEIEDPRPADVDYDVFVECQLPGQQFLGRFTRPEHRVRRADADAEGRVAVTVTFAAADQGPIRCRGAAELSPNAAIPQENPPTWTVLSDTPVFDLAQPADGQCFGAGEVVVGGSGRRLTANGARLEAVVTPEGGAAGEPVALERQGDDAYAVTFGGAAGPEALADGRYHVAVSGRVQGDAPIAVSPAEGVDFVVDTTAPSIELIAPADGAELGPEQDADGDASNCVQTTLQLQLADLSATRLCYTINGSAEFCDAVDEDGVFAPVVDLLDGDNVIGVRAVDCGGRETTRTFHLGAVGCPPRLQVVAPVDGARLAAGADVDPDTAGLQLDVRVESALAEGTEIVVAVVSELQDATFGPVAVGADGSTTVRATVELPAEPAGPFDFRLQPRLADGAASGPAARITFLFTPPTIELGALGACLNATYVDAAVAPGFQLAVTATAQGVDPGAAARVTATCGDAEPFEAQGVVGDGGAIAFDLLTLPDEADCDLTARVTDAAGQEGADALAVRIDRVAPQIRVLTPAHGTQITAADDEVPGDEIESEGLQLTPQIEVCGAAGQILTVETAPALSDDGQPFALDIGEGDCAIASLGQRTLPAGDLEIRARATDACGNEAVAVSASVVDPDSSISIREPAEGTNILAGDDEDENTAGCQVYLRAVIEQLGAEAEYFVCTSANQGAGPEACDGRSSALAPAGCSVEQGAGGPELNCLLSLQDGRHTLSVVGVFGEPVESGPISVLVDCTEPTVEAFVVPQDADANACVNRVERRRPERINDRAEFDLRATITGIEDGRSVTLLRAPNRDRVTSAIIANGQVQFPLDLDQGTHNLYLSSSDAAGNRLPDFNDPDAFVYRLQIDTLRPQTQLVGLAADACLNGGADADPGADGLQYAVRASALGQPDEALTGRLAIDGREPVEQAALGGQVAFPAQAIGEGAHEIRVTVLDACGNAASVAGFERVDNLDDWSRPLPVSFKVDTVAPVPVIAGLDDGQVLTDDDDADGDPANGFQSDLEIDFDPRAGIEAGRTVELRANGRPLATQPAALLVPPQFQAPIDARVTLGPGDQVLTAVAGDACGNVGTSAPVAVSARLSGCLSALVFAEEPVVFGPTDGAVGNGTLTVAGIDGTVAVDINADCVGTQAELVTGPAGGEQVLGAVAVPANGAVRFANVALPRGIDDLRIRIVLNGRTTFSPTERVIVDLDVPAVAISTPAAPEPAPVQADTDGNPANGLQTTVTARVTEANIATNSARAATLEVDGQQVASRDALDQTSPLDVTFTDVTLAEGPATLRICITDAAGNQGCATRQVLVDPAAPGAPELEFEIVHPRSTEVELTFAAPGDNGAAGAPVAAFEVRRSNGPIADDNAWNLATLIGNYPNTAQALGAGAPFQPGAQVALSLVDAAALPLHQNHFVAVRAIDDAGRLGGIAAVNVDLRLRTAQFDIGPANFWPSETFLNQRSLIQGLGDLNGDGHGDAIVSALAFLPVAPFTEFRQVALILSAGDGEPANAQVVPLVVPTVNGTALSAFGGFAGSVGDVDGDGTPDFAVVGVSGGNGAVALYFGGGNAAQIAAADVVILTPGRFVTYATGIGNFNQLAGDPAGGYGDLAIGGANGNANNFVNVVAGRSRAAWTAAATIDASQYNAATGITRLVAGAAGATVAAAGKSIAAGDIDGDGRTEVIFSGGGSFGRVFLFEGGDALAATLTHPVANNGSREIADLCPPAPGGATSFWGSNMFGGVDLDGQPGEDFAIGNYNIKKIVTVSGGLLRLDCFGRNPASYGAYMNDVGDVNDDGARDIIASHLDDGHVEAHIFYNDGAGRFGGDEVGGQRSADITLNSFPRRKRGVDGLGDIDGDGFDDFGVVYKEPGGALRAVLYY